MEMLQTTGGLPVLPSPLPAPPGWGTVLDGTATGPSRATHRAMRNAPAHPLEPRCTLVIRLNPRYRTAGLLKVLSVLHSRRVTIHQMQYGPGAGEADVATVECSLGPTAVETICKSVANAVPVLAVSSRTASVKLVQ